MSVKRCLRQCFIVTLCTCTLASVLYCDTLHMHAGAMLQAAGTCLVGGGDVGDWNVVGHLKVILRA